MVQSHLMQTAKIVKTEKEPGRNISSSTIGRHIQWKEIDTSVNSTTLKNKHLVREFWTARRTSKKLFHLGNKLMGNTTQNPLPPNKTDEELAEDFTEFFLSKIEKIRDKFINTQAY